MIQTTNKATSRTRTIRILGTALLVFPVFTNLEARDAGMAVLPFRVSGNADPIYFSAAELPGLFQDATHFLFESTRDHGLQPVQETNRGLERAGFKPDMRLDEKRAAALCLETDASHLLAGSATFLAGSRLSVEAVTFSCGERKAVGHGKQAGSVGSMQRLLRAMIAEAAPFARPLSEGTMRPALETSDTVMIVDFSGSMVYDLASLSKAVSFLSDRVPRESRLGMIAIEDGRQETLPLSRDWSIVAKALQSKRAAGEVTRKDLDKALATVEEFRDWKGKRRLMIVSDIPTTGRMTDLESRLRRLRARGVEIVLFCTVGQSQETRAEWTRIARSLGSPDPAVVYGRRAGFLEGFSVYLVMSGPRFYRADKDISADIERNKIKLEDVNGIETIRFEKSSLNLADLPKKYAESEGLRLAGVGPMISGLEQKVVGAVLEGTPAAPSAGRILLRNEGQSFWISVQDRGALRALSQNAGQSLYVGLSFRADPKSAERIANDPNRVYLKSQGKVPRLFVNTWTNLSSSPTVHPEDIWFVLCEVREVRDSAETHDIRE